MGIGAAFAMGLVSGFTRNIEQEKQRRLADEQKVDLLEQQLFKSALEGDATNAGIEAASSLIKSSRTKLQDRKPIDLFGTQTDGIDLDFTSMKSSIDNVSKYGTSYGTGANVFGTAVDIYTSPSTEKSILFLSDAERILNDKDVLAKMAAGDKTAREKFFADIRGNVKIIMRDAMSNKLEDEQLLIPEFGPRVMDVFGGDPFIIDFVAEQTGADSVTVKKTDQGKQPEPFIIKDPKAQIVYKSLAESVLPENTNSAQFSNYYYEQYLSLVPTMTPDQLGKYLFGSISLAMKIPTISALDTDVGFVTREDAIMFYPIIEGVAGEKFIDQVLMLAPHMTPPAVEKADIPGYVTTITGETSQEYVIKATGKRYKEFGEIEKEAELTETTYNDLVKLRALRGSKGMSSVTAYNSFKKYLFGGIDIVTSAVKDVYSSMADGVEDPDRVLKPGEKYIDEAYVQKLQERVDNAGEFAEYEALTIALAFKMARAADPSGRLSNQDIEQQLRRLGDSIDSQGAAVSKINLLIDEYGAQRDKLSVLVTYGRGTDVINQDRARVIDAALVLSDMRTASKNSAANDRASKTYTPSEKPMSNRQTKNGDPVYVALDENNIPINPPVFVDVNGNKLNTDQLVTIEPKPPADPESKPPADTETTGTETAPVAIPEDTSNAADEPPADSGKAPPSDDTVPDDADKPPAPDANQPPPETEFLPGGDNVTGMKLKGYEGLWRYDNGQWNRVN